MPPDTIPGAAQVSLARLGDKNRIPNQGGREAHVPIMRLTKNRLLFPGQNPSEGGNYILSYQVFRGSPCMNIKAEFSEVRLVDADRLVSLEQSGQVILLQTTRRVSIVLYKVPGQSNL
jgi:hypothetical protein